MPTLRGTDGPESAQPARRLSELAEQAVRCTAGCCGAGTTVTDGGTEQPAAVTHPDLARLVAVQLRSGDGPIPAARERGAPVDTEDLLHDERWPEYRALALDSGVRASVTLPFRRSGLTLTLSLFSFRPGALDDAGCGPAQALGDFATAGLVRDRHYRAALTELDHLGEALRTRPVVDQACGIIMHVVTCDADRAFTLLRRVSQQTNRKLAEVAAALVETKGRGLERELKSVAE
ncbi:ANTAR domain-containing response regulator [Streptomyces aureocirculatus]|uniref:ANTAR domain-containing response regulator n=1 Tax=Streptomyces aureocirculatus TaxID=67275 RepID=UPI0004CA091B